jgi:hypothetical protein
MIGCWFWERIVRFFRRRDIYSRDRGSKIITDISIETCLPEEKEYSLLTVIECKDYDGTIPVGKIEEFCNKVEVYL